MLMEKLPQGAARYDHAPQCLETGYLYFLAYLARLGVHIVLPRRVACACPGLGGYMRADGTCSKCGLPGGARSSVAKF